MTTPLPHFKKDRTAATFYQTASYLRYWDGTNLLCEHKLKPTSCVTCRSTPVREESPALASEPAVATALTPGGWAPLRLPTTKDVVIVGLASREVGKRFLLSHRLAGGSFGEVYVGSYVATNERVAIKIEKRTLKTPMLLNEYNLYHRLPRAVGIPQVYWCGSNKHLHFMAMELLGATLKAPCAVLRVSNYAQQMLTRLEYLHSHGYIHRDLKPENFVLGVPHTATANTVYLLDFGLVKRYLDEQGRHIPLSRKEGIVGTPRYISTAVENKYESSRRDDLESLAYVLVYLIKGKLPWQNLKAPVGRKREMVTGLKTNTTAEELCVDLPEGYTTYLKYCRGLTFTETPNYDQCRSYFCSKEV